jgi:hypothetical protein
MPGMTADDAPAATNPAAYFCGGATIIGTSSAARAAASATASGERPERMRRECDSPVRRARDHLTSATLTILGQAALFMTCRPHENGTAISEPSAPLIMSCAITPASYIERVHQGDAAHDQSKSDGMPSAGPQNDR